MRVKNVITVVACVVAMFGLSLRLAINFSLSVALWWLFLPEPYSEILSAIVLFGTTLSIGMLGLVVYVLLKPKKDADEDSILRSIEEAAEL